VNIILNGFMATGKTTIGQCLAKRLKLPFVDLDQTIETEQKLTISELFEQYGETAFRKLETEKLNEVLEQNGVIALGGGALTNPENLKKVLQSDNYLIGLYCSMEDIIARTNRDKGIRPLLSDEGDNLKISITNLLEKRRSVYNQCDFQVDTSQYSPEESTEKILQMIRNKQTRIQVPDGYYPIWMGRQLLQNLGELIAARCKGKKIAIITNPVVGGFYLETVEKALQSTEFETKSILIPDGEEGKSLETVNKVYDELTAFKADRSSIILALGGGITGDIAGFAAATYMRGIRFIQIPTTLLAMVDSSVGGKTGVNLPQGKNLVGAFKQPELVVMDLEVLKTLPEREIINGFGEFFKHGLIADAELVRQIVEYPGDLSTLPYTEELEAMLSRSLEVKANIVQRDPFEANERMLLNFGHTLGHAIEKATSYTIAHGEAVLIGMAFAAKLSTIVGKLPIEEYTLIENIYKKYNLPYTLHQFSIHDLINYMQLDKKKNTDEYRWILLRRIGEGYIETFPSLDQITELLHKSGARA
jgi:shikimate kinase / 3-dehydroquinate synthase